MSGLSKRRDKSVDQGTILTKLKRGKAGERERERRTSVGWITVFLCDSYGDLFFPSTILHVSLPCQASGQPWYHFDVLCMIAVCVVGVAVVVVVVYVVVVGVAVVADVVVVVADVYVVVGVAVVAVVAVVIVDVYVVVVVVVVADVPVCVYVAVVVLLVAVVGRWMTLLGVGVVQV